MMKNWKSIFALLLAVLMIVLAGCGSQNDPSGTTESAAQTETAPVTEESTEPVTETQTELPTEETAASEPVTETSPEEPTTEGTPGVLKLDQLEDCLDWIGKTAKKAGIPKSCLFYGEDDLLEVTLEGSLFGKEAQGFACLQEGTKKTTVCQVEFTCTELTYEEARAALAARYGEPVEEKTDRSGQTAQGDVTWAVFENGKSEVWLSKGTLEDFVRIEAY